jgi:hypothetical protein
MAMRHLLVAIPISLVLCASAVVASPISNGNMLPSVGGSGAGGVNDHHQFQRKQHALFAALQEGRLQQIADGGTLTDTHKAALHQRLVTIQKGNY